MSGLTLGMVIGNRRPFSFSAIDFNVWGVKLCGHLSRQLEWPSGADELPGFEIGARITDDRPGRVQEQSCNPKGHEQVGPWASKPCNKDSGHGDCRVADRVVTRKQPHRAHIGVSLSEPQQRQDSHDIDQKSDEAKQAHQTSIGRRLGKHAPNRRSKYSEAKEPKEHALDQGGPCTPDKGPTDRQKAKKSNQAVADEIKRIRLQSLRPG